jgi:uncharacterized protein (UPF0332 family)
MDENYYIELTKLRLERANELLIDAKDLLERESYKSANNRAFYAIEKGIKALLSTELVEVSTHSGGLKQFNYYFIYKGDGTFTQEDFQKIARAEKVRSVSDYDDFYIANKKDAKQQVEDAEYILNKIKEYISKKTK